MEPFSSKAQIKASTVALLYRFYGFTFVAYIVVGVAEWVCLLAVLDPQVWMPAAHVARWIYAVALFVPVFNTIVIILFARATSMKVPLTQYTLLWLLLGLLCNIAAIIALLSGNYALALTLGFGWSALSAIKKWTFPSEKEKVERHRRTDGVFAVLAFALLAATLELRFVPLSLLLFVEQLASLSVLFLRTIKETRRVTSEQKEG